MTNEDDGAEPICMFENGEWITNLKYRVTSLGKELLGKAADYTFPLDFIAECLEGRYILYNVQCTYQSFFVILRI